MPAGLFSSSTFSLARPLPRALLALLAAATVAGCRGGGHQLPPPEQSTSPSGDPLIKADLDFAAATKARGVDGWVEAFADDGSQYTRDGLVTGHDAIRALMKEVFADPNFSLVWKPVRAEIAAGGTIGYTWGRYRQIRKTDGGEVNIAEGTYTTVWKKVAEGVWKVIFDTGDPDAAPTPAK